MNYIYQIIVAIIAAFVSAALAPRPPAPKPAELEDFDAPTAEEGRPIAVAFGEVLITGPNVVWYGDLYTSAISSGGGGKK